MPLKPPAQLSVHLSSSLQFAADAQVLVAEHLRDVGDLFVLQSEMFDHLVHGVQSADRVPLNGTALTLSTGLRKDKSGLAGCEWLQSGYACHENDQVSNLHWYRRVSRRRCLPHLRRHWRDAQ
jgi:hypothetical protein